VDTVFKPKQKELRERIRSYAQRLTENRTKLDLASDLMELASVCGLEPEESEQLCMLADDDSPEVRKIIANQMNVLNDDLFYQITSKLHNDSNAYVRTAARHSINRRQNNPVLKTRKSRNPQVQFVERTEDLRKEFARKYGQNALNDAQILTNHQFEILVATTLHNIKNIITPIKTGCTKISDPRAKRRTEESLHSLEHFLEEMKNYSKSVEYAKRREEVTKIIEDATQTATSGYTSDTEIPDIFVTYSRPDLEVYVAKHQIVMAVTNCLRNSLEALRANPVEGRTPKIEIASSHVDGGLVEIRISDNGLGVHPDDLEKLKMFMPGRKSPSKPTGTGFGLPIVKKYIAANGGTVSLENEEEKGMTVIIRLPISGDEV
jgi:signal transduction histidine kinase